MDICFQHSAERSCILAFFITTFMLCYYYMRCFKKNQPFTVVFLKICRFAYDKRKRQNMAAKPSTEIKQKQKSRKRTRYSGATRFCFCIGQKNIIGGLSNGLNPLICRIT